MSVGPSPAPRSPRIVLASASPRRRRLFAWYGVAYETASVDVDEAPDPSLAGGPAGIATDIAVRKVAAARELYPDDIVVACDTLVFLDGVILGKPEDLDDAHRMLQDLSGREHQVVTGVAVARPDAADPVNISVVTNVHMHELTAEDRATWAGEGELMGCAGAYNIERHLAYVHDDECYQNVAGLPLCHLYLVLSVIADDLLPEPLERPDVTCDAARGAFCKIGPCMLGRCC